MSDQRIVPNNRRTVFSSPRENRAIRLDRGRFRLPGWLGWRQWLVLFGMGIAVILIEVRNHTAMWAEHQSGQTVWTDPELVWEIFLFGLVLPVVAGVVFGYLARTSVERDQIAQELELRRGLVERMHSAKSHQELAEVIVTVPGNTALADRAWLLAQRSGEDAFEQIALWERPGLDRSPFSVPVAPADCEGCERAKSAAGTNVHLCHHMASGDGSAGHNRYCLWLTSESTGKATLLFDTPAEHRLHTRELKVLDDLGGEISLAIENANLLHLKQRQVDAARDERLRIARNLHDTVGQNVSYLRFKLDQLSTSAVTSEPAVFQNELSGTVAVADEIFEQMRDTLEELRTNEQQDLEQSIRDYAGQAAARGGFSVNVQTMGQSVSATPRVSRQILYIVREALNNVEKHAGAELVDICLQDGDEGFILTVRDDGVGFQPEEVETADHYGIAIMEERAQAIHGELAIDSRPGKGTEVALILPLTSGTVDSSRDQ
ncbi:MAG: sensor histidine kinase [Chloroflexota bacterium]